MLEHRPAAWMLGSEKARKQASTKGLVWQKDPHRCDMKIYTARVACTPPSTLSSWKSPKKGRDRFPKAD